MQANETEFAARILPLLDRTVVLLSTDVSRCGRLLGFCITRQRPIADPKILSPKLGTLRLVVSGCAISSRLLRLYDSSVR
jgi:hypothetical protein